jgi:hypothetical protein
MHVQDSSQQAQLGVHDRQKNMQVVAEHALCNI